MSDDTPVLDNVLEAFGNVLACFSPSDQSRILGALAEKFGNEPMERRAVCVAMRDLIGNKPTTENILAYARAHREEWANLASMLLTGTALDDELPPSLDRWLERCAREIEFVPPVSN